MNGPFILDPQKERETMREKRERKKTQHIPLLQLKGWKGWMA